MEVDILSYGATIKALRIPTKNNKIIDVVLGFDLPEQYMQSFANNASPYFGAVVGRYAGRIQQGEFLMNGQTVCVEKNLMQKHHLHGGKCGLSMSNWEMMNYQEDGKSSSVTLQYLLKQTDDFFPGDLLVTVTYSLTEMNALKVSYEAVCTKDTIVNLTQHSYFNLDGHDGDVQQQLLFVNAAQVLATDADLIPTGDFIDLANHPFDFSSPKACPKIIDTSFVVHQNTQPNATLYSPQNQISMHVYTDQPSVHVYVGGKLDADSIGKQQVNYHTTSGICFETQHFPDSPNHDSFPTTLLRKGETYHQTTIFKFEI